MTSIATLRLPTSEFALEETLMEFPDVSARFLRSASVGGDASMPVLWVRGDSLGGFGASLERDPSVASVSRLVDAGSTRLYGMEWDGARVDSVDSMGGGGRLVHDDDVFLLDGAARDGAWTFRALARERCGLGAVTDHWTAEGVVHDVERVTTLDDVPNPGQFGLTPAQHEALATAHERGYYDVPRRADIESVAESLGVSHQAASERLRRGHERLVGNTLLRSTEPTLQL